MQVFYAVASSNSSNVIVLFLAQVMGTYFCAMVILMRMNMPLEYRCEKSTTAFVVVRASQSCALFFPAFVKIPLYNRAGVRRVWRDWGEERQGEGIGDY